MCWLTPSEGFPGDVVSLTDCLPLGTAFCHSIKGLAASTSIRRRASTKSGGFPASSPAKRRRPSAAKEAGHMRQNQDCEDGVRQIRQRPARQFRLAHGGVRFGVGAGGGLRRQSGAALQRQVRLAQRARRGGHLHCARPHHRQDRSRRMRAPASKSSSMRMALAPSQPISLCSTRLLSTRRQRRSAQPRMSMPTCSSRCLAQA